MIEEHLFITIHFNKYPSVSTPLIFSKTCLAWEFIFWGGGEATWSQHTLFDMKTTLKSIRDRVTGSSKVKLTVRRHSWTWLIQVTVSLLKCLFSLQSLRQIFLFLFHNPWEATDGGNQEVVSGEEGWRIFCSMGTRIHPLWWAAVHPGFDTWAVLSWVCPLLHGEPLLRQEGQGLIRRFVRVSVSHGREGGRD